MADQRAQDLDVDAAARDGAKRLTNQRHFGTCALIPPDSIKGCEDSIRRGQKKYLSAKEMDTFHMELYRRVQSFLDFWDANVGLSEDYPIIFMAESEGAEDMFMERVAEMRSAVGVLTEL